MRWVVVDFETSSGCDLKKAGAWRYAEDPTTNVLVLCWEFDDRRRGLWHPGEPLHPDLLAAIANGTMFVAHNAAFEQAIWKHLMVALYGWPAIPLEQWHDTMARCAELALPQGLEKVLPVLNLPISKDMEGNKLTLSLSKPGRKGYTPQRTPAVMERIDQYCMSDIAGQVALHKRLGWLTDGERPVWLMNERMNQRGIMIDIPFVRAAQKIVDDATVPLAAEFREITGGLSFTQGAKVIEWAAGQGIELPNMQKETLAKLLGLDENEVDVEEDPQGDMFPELPAHVRRALHIRQLVGSSSVKKLGAMQSCVCSDGRARGLVAYHVATTGRFAGRLLQPQNFPRGTNALIATPVDAKVGAIMTGDWEFVEATLGPAVEAVVGSLRHALIAAPGKTFISGDYAQIEARVLLAMAGQWDKVDLFASGLDPYCDMATSIYGETVTKKDTKRRQIGKNSVLGLGFGMGDKKFHIKYAPDQTPEFCEGVVGTYRNDWAPNVPQMWYTVGDAALECMLTGIPQEAYGLVFERIDRWLTMLLPSGRRLWYDEPKVEWREMPWSTPDEPAFKKAWSYRAMKQGKRITIYAFGAHIVENAVQALARDILVVALDKLDSNGFPSVLTVHDEGVSEVPACNADESAVVQIMEDVEPWAREMRIPIKVEAWTGDRYRK